MRRFYTDFTILSLITLSLCISVRAASSSTEDVWNYVQKLQKGALTVTIRDGKTLISVRQFCFAFRCHAFYQWSHYRVIIQNLHEPTDAGAIISPLTRVALINGKVVDYEGQVLSSTDEGYLLPMDLATKLAIGLNLGKVEHHQETIDVKPKELVHSLDTLIIDPGHGGTDYGTSSQGLYEKDIALIYAIKLRDEIHQAMPEIHVFLTRDDDKYVSLPDRAHLANAKDANLFLSLHVNHSPNAEIKGVETYILSPDATDAEAKRTAILENDAWLKDTKIKDAGATVRQILADMEQTKYIQDSALAGALIQQELANLDHKRGLKNRGVKQALFYVLSQVAMPSILVEMGFLSNASDRGRMMNFRFRDDFVKDLVTALRRYRDKQVLKEVSQ